MRHSRQPAQVLVLFALALPAMLGMIGLGIDFGFFMAQRQRLQSAADLAALNAMYCKTFPTKAHCISAASYPGAGDMRVGMARSTAKLNHFTHGTNSTTVNVTEPTAETVRVEIASPYQTYFLQAIGVSTMNLGAVAVASTIVGDGYAIFAGSTDCVDYPLEMSGSNNVIGGNIHSNGMLKVNGSDVDVNGTATYRCGTQISGYNVDFDSGPTVSGIKPYPVNYTAADFPCNYTNRDYSQNGTHWVGGVRSSKQLSNGVHCKNNGDLVIGDQGVSGNVTLVSTGKIEISGSDFNLSAHTSGVLAYSSYDGPDAIKISGSDGDWLGMLFAPNGKAYVSGSENSTATGSIIAETVQMAGSGWDLSYQGGGGTPRMSLIE